MGQTVPVVVLLTNARVRLRQPVSRRTCSPWTAARIRRVIR